jgi:uncharacterized protein YgiM (DUF1202 family)
MYYRSRGTRQFIIYLLVILLALTIGLSLGAAYPEPITQFFPSLSTRITTFFNQIIGSGENADFPAQITETASSEAVTFTPSPTEVLAPVQSGSALLPPRPTPETCVVRTGFENGTINIRSGAGSTFPVIGTAHEGDVISLIGPEDENGWAPILTKDKLNGYFYLRMWCK